MKRMTKIILTGLVVILVSACSLLPSSLSNLFSAATEVPAVQATPTQEPTLAARNIDVVDSEVLAVVQNTFQSIYTNVNPSVVNIQVSEYYGPQVISGEGSGFVWDNEGHIVTNSHVVDGASDITVIFADGTTAAATLVGNDPESDLAVIKVDPGVTTLYPAAVGDSRAVQVGDIVIAIGNPYGLSGTMTQGIVSALSRSLSVDDESSPFYTSTYTIPDIIQTDTAINPGNSGGVLVNMAGEVIGVTSAIQSSSDSNSGIGFVIPSHIVKRVVPVLIQDGSYDHPRLGISATTVTPAIAESVGLDTTVKGVLIVNVIDNSPAEKAGLVGSSQQRSNSGKITTTAGDVITAIDGQPLDTYEDLVSYMFNNTEVGQKVTLSIIRDGKLIQVDVNL